MAGIAFMLSTICLNSTCAIDNATTTNVMTAVEGVQFYDANGAYQSVTYDGDNQQTYSQLYDKNATQENLKRELNGKVLRIATLEDYPLSYIRDENGTKIGEGVAFKVLQFLTEKFNFTYEIVNITQNIIGSSVDKEGIVKSFADKGVDMAVAFLPIISDVRNFLTYSTTSLDEGEWIMIMKRPKESAGGSGLVAPFDRDVWYLILVSLLAVGPIIYGLIILRYKLTKDTGQKNYPLPHCVWFVYGALMKQGSTLSPVADSTRLLFATWWIFITILTSFYTANLTAFLTLSQFTLPFNNVDDIRVKNKFFVTQRGGLIEYAIKNQNESLPNLQFMVQNNHAIFSAENDTQNLKAFVEEKDYVYVRDRPAIDHLIYKDYRERKTVYLNDEKKQCPFAVSKTPFIKRKRTFAYSKENFPYKNLFDPELLHLVESGIIKYMLSENLPNTEICPQNLGGTERQLRNADLTMTYWIMAAGFATSVVVFFTEIFFKCANFRLGFRNKLSSEMSHHTNDPTTVTPPPSYAALFQRNKNKVWTTHSSPKHTMTSIQPNGTAIIQPFGRNYFRTEYGVPKVMPGTYPPSSTSIFQYSYTK